jgi:hypothetical protein
VYFLVIYHWIDLWGHARRLRREKFLHERIFCISLPLYVFINIWTEATQPNKNKANNMSLNEGIQVVMAWQL